MRGVHLPRAFASSFKVGSSPHARGPHGNHYYYTDADRIIPACAGSTPQGWDHHRNSKDHPRMRGVHVLACVAAVLALGSSPHARGPQIQHSKFRFLVGIIPACAGSTRTALSRTASNRDHPRMRGVHSKMIIDNGNDVGSSPHARGPLARPVDFEPFGGIIPACAGSTYSFSFSVTISKDHPRMRGVHPPCPRWGLS